MKPVFWLMAVGIAVSACAIKRPLIAPKDIPAYEKRMDDKRLEREEFLREQQRREQELEQIQQQNQQGI